MKNISFDNPYLLLIAIPMLLVVLVSFFIAIRKDNKSKSVVTSLVLHIIIAIITSLAIAGTTYTTVITKTEVVVVADVSYSAADSADKIDAYIAELEKSLVGNSDLAVVAFGRDYSLIKSFEDEELVSVRGAGVDDSATDIAAALDYSATLFGEDSIKRLILITDAGATDGSASRLVQSVDNLFAMDVTVDAIYLDSNIAEDEAEVQISAVDCVESTYRGHESSADVLINSTYDGRAILTLNRNGEEYSVSTVELSRGFNILNIDLPTDTDGVFEYTVTARAERDSSEHNNSYLFTQTVSGDVRVLFITTNADDITRAAEIYGENAVIDSYNASKKSGRAVPYTVEELAKYDEIILSDVDVRELNNYTAFINSVEVVVSQFGKSLMTFGNCHIQNKTEAVLENLQNMLPVSFGNSDRDAKLMTIVIDVSRSMQSAYRLITAKEAAIAIINLLEDNDRVGIVAFWGENYTVTLPTPASEKDALIKMINDLEAYQGTMIGSALDSAYSFMKDLDYSDKQVVLISDGLSYIEESGEDGAIDTAADMYADGIVVSTINTLCTEADAVSTMSGIAMSGGGSYYYIESAEGFEDQFYTEIADDMFDETVDGDYAVKVNRKSDAVLDGITHDSIPSVYGFVYSKAKASARVVLAVDYVKVSGGTVEAPLYAYWDYGNGTVSCYTSSLSGEWASGWSGETGGRLLSNMVTENLPKEKLGYPFTFNTDFESGVAYVEMIPVNLKADATVLLEVTTPSGVSETYTLTYDSTKYFYSFPTSEVGSYSLHLTYSYSDKVYEADRTVSISYFPEYNSFATFTATPLYKAIRNRGQITEDRLPEYEVELDTLTTYVTDFTVPFLIAAVALYVIDVIIRKLKWADITGLFKKSGRRKGA